MLQDRQDNGKILTSTEFSAPTPSGSFWSQVTPSFNLSCRRSRSCLSCSFLPLVPIETLSYATLTLKNICYFPVGGKEGTGSLSRESLPSNCQAPLNSSISLIRVNSLFVMTKEFRLIISTKAPVFTRIKECTHIYTRIYPIQFRESRTKGAGSFDLLS